MQRIRLVAEEGLELLGVPATCRQGVVGCELSRKVRVCVCGGGFRAGAYRRELILSFLSLSFSISSGSNKAASWASSASATQERSRL